MRKQFPSLKLQNTIKNIPTSTSIYQASQKEGCYNKGSTEVFRPHNNAYIREYLEQHKELNLKSCADTFNKVANKAFKEGKYGDVNTSVAYLVKMQDGFTPDTQININTNNDMSTEHQHQLKQSFPSGIKTIQAKTT